MRPFRFPRIQLEFLNSESIGMINLYQTHRCFPIEINISISSKQEVDKILDVLAPYPKVTITTLNYEADSDKN